MKSESEIYVFHTTLTAAQTAEALRSSMDESELDFIFRINARGHRSIIGNADEKECHLMRRPGFFMSDYAGVFSAAIFEERCSTRLDGRFEKLILGFPLRSKNSNVGSIRSIIVSILFLTGFQAYNAIGAFIEQDHPIFNPASFFAGVLLIVVCISYLTATRAKKQQREFILQHVKTVLNASLSTGVTD